MMASELIAALEDLIAEHGDLDVMVAHQPNYPLAADPVNVTACLLEGKPTIFIACSASERYAPRAAWEEGPSLDDEEDS